MTKSCRYRILKVPVNVFRAACFAVVISAARPVTTVADDITVTLRDGRQVQGQLASATDDTRLWISRAEQSIVVVSGHAWTDVAAVTRENKTVEPAELRQKATGMGAEPLVVRSLVAEKAHVHPQPSRRTDSLTLKITACVESWDADADPDGLLVSLTVLDSVGLPVPIRGDLTLVLRGFVHHVFDKNDRKLTPAATELGRKYLHVRQTDFHDGSLTLKMEVDRAILLNPAIEPLNVLHARLGIPSYGVLEARSGVSLRPWDPLVDRLPCFEGATLPRQLWGEPHTAGATFCDF